MNFSYFQLARRSFRFPSQLICQGFAKGGRVCQFCEKSSLGTPNGRTFSNTERYALHHGTQHMLEVNDHNSSDKSRTNGVKAGQVYQYPTDLELIYAKLCIKSTSIIEDLLGLHGDNSSILSDERVFLVTSLLSLLRKHSYYLLIILIFFSNV